MSSISFDSSNSHFPLQRMICLSLVLLVGSTLAPKATQAQESIDPTLEVFSKTVLVLPPAPHDEKAIGGTGRATKAIGGTGRTAKAIGGTGRTSKAIGGTGRAIKAIGGTGRTSKAIGGTGRATKAIGGTGRTSKAIGGTGRATKAIGGTGRTTKAIGGTGRATKAIGGTGRSVKAIGGTGRSSKAIGGTGRAFKAIGGTGRTTKAIGGTGRTSKAIGGTGRASKAIGGTGRSKAIGGTGRFAKSTSIEFTASDAPLLRGTVEAWDASSRSLQVLGQRFQVQGDEQFDIGAIAVVEGTLSSDGMVVADYSWTDTSDVYVPGSTNVVITGRITSVDAGSGRLAIGSLIVDYTQLLWNSAFAPLVGTEVCIVGTQAVLNGEVQARAASFR